MEQEILDLNLNEGVQVDMNLPTLLSTANQQNVRDIKTYEAPTFTESMREKFSTELPYSMVSGNKLSDQLANTYNDPLKAYGTMSLDNDFIKLKSGKYIPKYERFLAGVDNNERMAYLQNNDLLEEGVWSRGLDRFLSTAGTTFLGGLTDVPLGIVNAINKGSWDAYYDTDFANWLDELSEKSKYGGNQIYYSKAEEDLSIGAGAITKKFWADKVLGGAAFTVGTMGSEALWALATGGASWGARGALKGLQTTLRGADKISDVARSGSIISRVMKKVNTAIRNGATIANDARALSTSGSGAVSAGKNLGKIGELAHTLRFSFTSAAYEAGFEARSMKNESEKAFNDFYKEKYGRVPSGEEWSSFQKELEDSSKTVAIANLALLSVSNVAIFGKMFGVKSPMSIIRGHSGVSTGNYATRKLFGYGVKTAEDGTKQAVKANFLQKGLNTLYGLSKAGAIEGVWEEGGQGVASKWMQNYMESTYDEEALGTAIKETSSLMSPFLKEAFEEQFTSKSGAEEMLIGAIIGGIFGGLGAISENKADRKMLEQTVEYDNTIKGRITDFINKGYTRENIISQTEGIARSLVAQENSDVAIEQGKPVKAQLKAQESLISMLDSAHSVGKDGSFVDALVTDMLSMDVNKISEAYGLSKKDAETFIKQNAKEVQEIAERYSSARSLAETIVSGRKLAEGVDAHQVVRGLTYALSMKGNVANIVQGAHSKLQNLFDFTGDLGAMKVTNGVVTFAISSKEQQEAILNLKNEATSLRNERDGLIKSLREAQVEEITEEGRAEHLNKIKKLTDELSDVENKITENDSIGEKTINTITNSLFGNTAVDYTYRDLIETFKEGKEGVESLIEKYKTKDPEVYLELKDAFETIDEGAEIFNSFDSVLTDLTSPDFKLKSKGIFSKENNSEKTINVLKGLVNIDISTSDFVKIDTPFVTREQFEKGDKGEIEAIIEEKIANGHPLSELEQEWVDEKFPNLEEDVLDEVEDEIDILITEHEENRQKKLKELEEVSEGEVLNIDGNEVVVTSTGLVTKESYGLANIPFYFEGFKQIGDSKGEVKSFIDPTGGAKFIFREGEYTDAEIVTEEVKKREEDKFYKTFVERLSSRFGVNVKFVDEVPNGVNAKGYYDANTNTAYLVKGKFDGSTAIHEIFGHPFLNKIKETNQELYQSLLKEASENKDIVEYVDGLYSEVQRNDEYILRALDLHSNNELNKVNPSRGLLNSIRSFVKSLSDFVKDLLGISETENIPVNTSIKDLAQLAVYGKNTLDLIPPSYEGKQEVLFQKEDLKSKREARIEEINKEFDALYIKLVEEGKITKERALKEMEKANRTNSEAFRAIKKDLGNVVLQAEEINAVELNPILNQEQSIEELSEIYGVDISKATKPTPEEIKRLTDLKTKEVLTEEEIAEKEGLTDKMLAYNVADGTIVGDGVSLLDVINLKAQYAKVKNQELNEETNLTEAEISHSNAEVLKETEKAIKDEQDQPRRYEIGQVTEDVVVNFSKTSGKVKVSHLSFSDILDKIKVNHPDVVFTTPEGEDVTDSNYKDLNGIGNTTIYATIGDEVFEMTLPPQSKRQGGVKSKSGKPVEIFFNENMASPEYQLNFLTGISVKSDNTINGRYTLAYITDENGVESVLKASEEFDIDSESGFYYDPVEASKMNENEEYEAIATLADGYNRELHHSTAEEKALEELDKIKAENAEKTAQKESIMRNITDEDMAYELQDRYDEMSETSTNGKKEVFKIFGTKFGRVKELQKLYDKALLSFNKFKNTKDLKKIRKDIDGGALNKKRFMFVTEVGKNPKTGKPDAEAKRGKFLDLKTKGYLTESQADKVMFDIVLKAKEKDLKKLDFSSKYPSIVYEDFKNRDITISDVLKDKAQWKIAKTLSSPMRAVSEIQKEIDKNYVKHKQIQDSIATSQLEGYKTEDFVKGFNVFIVKKGTNIVVNRLKAVYGNTRNSNSIVKNMSIRVFLANQLNSNNIEARMPINIDAVLTGMPIHNFENGEAIMRDVSESDAISHGYIENGTIFANNDTEFEDRFVKNISKNNADVKIPFVSFRDGMSGKVYAYPVTLNEVSGVQASSEIEDVLNSRKSKGKKLLEINDILMKNKVNVLATIESLEDPQSLLEVVSETSRKLSVEEFLNKFPTESGVVKTPLNFKGQAFTAPKAVFNLNSKEAMDYLHSVENTGVRYFFNKDGEAVKSTDEANKKCKK